MFHQLPFGTFIDGHPAPRRQYVIILSGRRFGPGDTRLVEDTTGRGHTTCVVGTDPMLTAVVPLAEQ